MKSHLTALAVVLAGTFFTQSTHAGVITTFDIGGTNGFASFNPLTGAITNTVVTSANGGSSADVKHISVDAAGNVVLAISNSLGTSTTFETWSPSGSLLQTFGGNSGIADLALGTNGLAYTTFDSGVTNGFAVFDPFTGAITNTVVTSAIGGSSADVKHIAVDAAGNIVLAISNSLGTSTTFETWSPSGSLLQTFGGNSGIADISGIPKAVPEPSSLMIFGSSALCLLCRRRRRSNDSANNLM